MANVKVTTTTTTTTETTVEDGNDEMSERDPAGNRTPDGDNYSRAYEGLERWMYSEDQEATETEGDE